MVNAGLLEIIKVGDVVEGYFLEQVLGLPVLRDPYRIPNLSDQTPKDDDVRVFTWIDDHRLVRTR